MALPANLKSTYTSLKEDTKYFTTWLVINARSPGIRSKDHAGTKPYARKTSRRHKGDKQSRKQSLQATDEADTPVDGQAASTTISVNKLLLLAESLLDITPPVRIPRSVMQAAKTAINARIQCSKWFAQYTEITPDIERSNQTHAHFNAVLQQILAILLPLEESQLLTQHDREPSTMYETHAQLSRFENLEIEDAFSDASDSEIAPAESSSTAAQRPARPSATKNALPTLTGPGYTIEDPAEEWLTAFSCALQDMRSLQKCIRRYCHEYKSGEIDCGTLSMTANTAVDMVEQLEAKLSESTPPKMGPLDLLDYFEDKSREARSQVRAMPKFVNTDDIAQHVYSLPRRALESWASFCDGCEARESPHLGQDWQQTEADLKLLDTATRQMYCLKSFWKEHEDTDTREIPLLDKFTTITVAIGRSAKTGRILIPLHSIFAAQLFLDIHHILGDQKCNQGLQDLQLATAKHRQILDGYQQFSRSVYAKRRLRRDDVLIQEALSRIETWVKEDVVEKERAKMATVKDELDIKASKPRELLGSHPWLCGALRFGFDVMCTLVGTSQLNHYEYANPLAHLYNAAWQEGFLDAQWADMEKILDMYPSKDIFAGSRPMKGNGYSAHFQCAGGVLAVTFAKNRRTNRVVFKKNGERALLHKCPHVPLLYFTYTLAGPLSIDPDMPLLTLMLEHAPYKVNSDHLARSETLRHKWLDQRQPLSPAEMMTFAKERLLGERDLIRFNYLGMVQRCHHLGRRLVERVDDVCLTWGYYDPVKTKQYDKVEAGMPITGWTACTSYEATYQENHTPIRMAVTELLKEFIRTEGDAESKALGFTRLIEAKTAEAPKTQPSTATLPSSSTQVSASTQPSASIQPEPPAPSRKGKEKEVPPSTSTASDWQSASLQGEPSQQSRKGKEKELLSLVDEVEETVDSKGSGPSHKGKEKEVLPTTSTPPSWPSTSVPGESAHPSRKGKEKEVLPPMDEAEETEKGKDSRSSGTKKETAKSLPAGSSKKT
ncbi:MAG: hypothetical protein Q9228_000920 [Teloschistes exilis]